MIAQGLQQLTQLVRDSDVIRQHELEDHPDIAFFTYRGDVKLVELPPLPRTHFVSSIGSLVEATKGFGKHGCPVWVSFSDVIALIDDEVNPDFQGRRSANICLSLKPSPIWNALVVATKAHSQQDLVDLLRHDFSDAMISPKLLDKVRQLKFSSQREEQGSFQQQNIEMGKKVAAQVAGSSEIPEAVSIEFEPFPSISEELEGFHVEIVCSVFVHIEKATISINPLPGQIDAAKVNSTAVVAAVLKKQLEDNLILLGKP